MNAGLIEALEALEKEKGISSDMLIESIELAMVSAYKKAKGFDGEMCIRDSHWPAPVSVVKLVSPCFFA